jgi:RNA polymerase sigma-70 factor (ECF subfamily)
MTEHQAITRLQGGDLGGLEPLMLRYQVAAMRTAYLILRDRGLAEDVAQNAFVQLPARLGRFDANRPFGPWFLRCVANDALKLATRRERGGSWEPLTEDEDPGLPDPGPTLDELVAAAETQTAIWAALGDLSPEQRTAIVLRYYLDLSETEMVARLGAPRGTIKWRLHAARQRLRQLLPAWVRPGFDDSGGGVSPPPAYPPDAAKGSEK